MALKHILRPFLATIGIMLIPLALQLTIGTGIDGQGWNWKPNDFVIMGTLVFITSLAVEFAVKKFPNHRFAAVVGIVFLFLCAWAELAVGVFTNLGS